MYGDGPCVVLERAGPIDLAFLKGGHPLFVGNQHIKITNICTMRIVESCLRHDLMVADSAPILAQGTQGATGLLTCSGIVSTSH